MTPKPVDYQPTAALSANDNAIARPIVLITPRTVVEPHKDFQDIPHQLPVKAIEIPIATVTEIPPAPKVESRSEAKEFISPITAEPSHAPEQKVCQGCGQIHSGPCGASLENAQTATLEEYVSPASRSETAESLVSKCKDCDGTRCGPNGCIKTKLNQFADEEILPKQRSSSANTIQLKGRKLAPQAALRPAAVPV